MRYIILVLLILGAGCHVPPGMSSEAFQEQRAVERHEARASVVAEEITYFADFRPEGGPICFAFRDRGRRATMSTVDCVQVRNMLPPSQAVRIVAP